MDEWNDFGAPAPDPSLNGTIDGDSSSSNSFPSRRTSHSAPQGSSRWSAHSSGAAEPCSVMFRGRPPLSSGFRDPNAASGPSHSDLGGDNPPEPTWRSDASRQNSRLLSDHDLEMGSDRNFEEAGTSVNTFGPLDTVGDFEEVGLPRSKRSTQSSNSRFHNLSYTKLEVISAQQIQELLHVFHVLIAVSISWTIFTIVCSNAIFTENQDVPMKASMLNEQQKSTSKRVPNVFTRQLVTNTTSMPSLFEDYQFSNDPMLPSTSIRKLQKAGSLKFQPEYSYPRCVMRRQGVYLIFNELVTGPKLTCKDVADPCYAYWKSQCDAGLDLVARQAGDVPFQPVGLDNGLLYLVPLRTEAQAVWYQWLINMVYIIGGTSLVILGSLFTIRLVRAGRMNISQEQMFACGLLFAAFLYFNVPLALININFINSGALEKFPEWFNTMQTPLRIIRDASLGPFLIFYLLLNIHSYRILDAQKKLDLAFFLPKLLLVLPYAIFRVFAFFYARAVLSEMAFISAIVVQHAFGAYHLWRTDREQVIMIAITTSYEFLLLVYTVFETTRTMGVLRRAPYLPHRSKHTGFRFFIYINFAYYITFFCLQLVLVLGRTSGSTIATFGITPKNEMHAYVPFAHTIGTTLLTFGYVIISAYVNLPFDSIGALKGWFTGSDLAPSSRWSSSSGDLSTVSDYTSTSNSAAGSHSYGLSRDTHSVLKLSRSGGERVSSRTTPTFIVDKDYELNQEVVEPVTYRKLESSDELRANCFTMQTHVIMFNFAWYVYYYGTSKFDRFERHESTDKVLPFRFKVIESIMEEETDTHALVISGTDRIIVAFKGSTSMRNLKTAIQVYHERLNNVVPTDLDKVDESQRLGEIFGRSYDNAKIHKGFAIAYASVAHRVMRCIKALNDDRPRPIFLTGHSLGGALATICSLDIWIKLRISRRQIFVSTFGSPRVGNEAFRRIYNSVIALHWRIVVDPDMVTRLPKVGYRHVGKKVVLTAHGQMYIDPSALELKLWSGSTVGFAYHRKASYLVAMKSWCMSNHRMSYTPVFWPFPVYREDYQRFEGAIAENEEPIEDGETPGQKMARKIILLDAMVDKLDNRSFTNNAVIEKWARLTRRLFLRHTLSGAVGNPFL